MKILLSILLVSIAAGCCKTSHSRKYSGVAALPTGRAFPQIVHGWTNTPSPRQITLLPTVLSDNIVVLDGPYDRLNEAGTHVDFTIVATNSGAGTIDYQWYKWTNYFASNTVAIAGATSSNLCIEAVGYGDVAGYEVVLSIGGVEYTNRMANLSVQTIACGASVQGTVQSPVTAVSWESGVTCDGVTFNYSFSPWHLGYPVVFYGPWVPASQQVGPGANTMRHPQLTVMTYHPGPPLVVNAPIDTAIQLFNEPGLTGGSGGFNDCNNNTPSYFAADPNAASLQHYLSSSSDAYPASYRPAIYFSSQPYNGNIYWSWRYHW